VNGGAYSPTTVCGTNSGTGGSAGATVTCSITGGSLVNGDSYVFKLKVTDSATAPESATSTGSHAVTVT
jgi:hypothetical protein